MNYTKEADTNWTVVDTTSGDIHLGAVVVLNSYGIDYTKAMTLQLRGASTATISIPDFDPSQYPDAARALPIAGYLSGLYYDPAHSGEGRQIEVTPSQLIDVTMFTFDDAGKPLWLGGAAGLCEICTNHSTRAVTIPMYAVSGGGFAGTTDASKVKRTLWGSIAFSWPTCNVVTMTLSPANSDPSLPSSSAQLSWSRLTSVEYAECAATTSPP